MENTLYKFAEVESRSIKPTAINEAIATTMRKDGGACYAEMERFLIAPGVTGSREFDKCRAVGILLKHDLKDCKVINNAMKTTASFTEQYVWSRLCAVLRRSGFKMKFGRVTGLIEHQLEDAPENSKPEKETAEAA